MANEKGVLRAVLGPALMAMAGVGLIAWLTSDREQTAAPAASAPAVTSPAAPQPEPAPEAPPGPEPEPALLANGGEPSEPTAPVAAGADGTATDADGGASRAELIRHGRLMIPAALLNAIEQNNVEHARAMRDQLQAKRAEGYMSNADFEALDLVVDCMENLSDAREEARDFLQFGSPSILSEPLKRACMDNR